MLIQSILLVILLIILLIIFTYLINNVEGFSNEVPSNTVYVDSDIFTEPLKELLQTEDGSEPIYKIETNPIPGLKKLNETCLQATEPKYILNRDQNQPYNCGWWYNEDTVNDTINSFARIGNEKEPVDFDGLKNRFPKGKWIWDLTQAQKMEDIKLCKRLKICELADLMPQKCGFCSTLGHGVPIDKNGNNLYKNSIEATCYTNPITNPYKCPCQGIKSLICNPNPKTGKLSKECLIKIARALGFIEEGALLRILNGDPDGYMNSSSSFSEKFRIAKSYLLDDLRITSRDAYFGKGVCLRNDVINYYISIKNATKQVKSERAKSAAGFLVNNSPFDMCYNDPTQTGPFELICLRRQAIENNIPQTSRYFPKIIEDIQEFDDKQWIEVKEYYKNKGLEFKKIIIENTENKDITSLNKGATIYIYEYNVNDKSSGIPNGIFLGKKGLDKIPDIDNTKYKLSNISDILNNSKYHFRIKGRFVSTRMFTSKFWILSNDGTSIRINNQNKLDKWQNQKVPTEYESADFNITEQTNFEIDWYNNSDTYKFYIRLWLNDKFDHIPDTMTYDFQPSKFPIARWDFYQGSTEDRCANLRSLNIGIIKVDVLDNKKCAIFNSADNYIQINNGIHTSAFKTITMMVNLKSNPSGPFRLWEFNNISTSGSVESLYSAVNPQNRIEFGYIYNGNGPTIVSAPDDKLKLNTWYHLAWVLNEKLDTMTMYLEGHQIGIYQNQSFTSLNDKIFRNMFILGGKDNYNKNIGVAWYRIFDYPLSLNEINLDKDNKFANAQMYPTDNTSGWQ